jgi:hypothetical protein
MRDTGMRNARELYRMRVENIDYDAGSAKSRVVVAGEAPVMVL